MPALKKVVFKAGMTPEDFEKANGITSEYEDCPPHFLGIPPSKYYRNVEPNFEESHVRASKNLTKLDTLLDRLGIR